MELLKFKEELEQNNGLNLTEDWVMFNDYELYNTETEESIKCTSYEEALEKEIDKKTIKQIIEEKEDAGFIDYGGRGASGISSSGGSIFGQTRVRGKAVLSAGNGNSMPSYMNTLVSAKSRDVDSIAKAFGKRTLNETREYSASLDEDGFAHSYNKGKSGSTAHLVYEGGYSIHNHPTKDKNGKTIAWNIYSKQDLKNSALDKGKGTIVVSNGNRTMYKFTKNKNFNSKAFIKGMSSAKGSTGNYDKDVDSWLRKNQKTYGYTYTKKKF